MLISLCVCVALRIQEFIYFFTYNQGAIPLTIGGWLPKRPMVRAVDVPAVLIRVTEVNGTRHTCVSVPFLLLSLF